MARERGRRADGREGEGDRRGDGDRRAQREASGYPPAIAADRAYIGAELPLVRFSPQLRRIDNDYGAEYQCIL